MFINSLYHALLGNILFWKQCGSYTVFQSACKYMRRWWPNTECWLVSFVVLQVIWTNIAKKPYIFVILEGGCGPPAPPPPPLDPHMKYMLITGILQAL